MVKFKRKITDIPERYLKLKKKKILSLKSKKSCFSNWRKRKKFLSQILLRSERILNLYTKYQYPS